MRSLLHWSVVNLSRLLLSLALLLRLLLSLLIRFDLHWIVVKLGRELLPTPPLWLLGQEAPSSIAVKSMIRALLPCIPVKHLAPPFLPGQQNHRRQ